VESHSSAIIGALDIELLQPKQLWMQFIDQP